MYTCLLALFGVIDFPVDEINATFHLPDTAVFLAFGFVVFGSVLLLNLVSARMASTYERVNEEARAEWQVALAELVLRDMRQRGGKRAADDVPKLDILLRDYWYQAGGGGAEAPPDPAAAAVAAAADSVHFADEVNAPLETVTRHGESYYERPPDRMRRPPRPAQQQRRAVAFGDAAPLTFIAGVAIGCGLMALVLQRSNK